MAGAFFAADAPADFFAGAFAADEEDFADDDFAELFAVDDFAADAPADFFAGVFAADEEDLPVDDFADEAAAFFAGAFADDDDDFADDDFAEFFADDAVDDFAAALVGAFVAVVFVVLVAALVGAAFLAAGFAFAAGFFVAIDFLLIGLNLVNLKCLVTLASHLKNNDVIKMLRINYYAIKRIVSRIFSPKTQYIVDIIFLGTKKSVFETKIEKIRVQNLGVRI